MDPGTRRRRGAAGLDLRVRPTPGARSQARLDPLRAHAPSAAREVGPVRDADALRAPRRGDSGDGVRRHPREHEAPGDRRARASASGAGLRRPDPARDHARVRAPGGGARARHHSGEHQSPRARADGDRARLPGQDQRQHRQLRGHLLDRGGGREDGVGDPLGRRHGDGPLDRRQHPRDPRVDPAQRAGADRHRADLPGARKGRRPPRGAHLGACSATP